MNWLITGGCGFIGSSLLLALRRDGGGAVRVVDDLSVGSRSDLSAVSTFREVPAQKLAGPPTGVELVVADIRDPDVAARAAEGIDVIVHLAANTGVQPSLEDPRHDCTTNVLGTLNYLEAARGNGVRSFVFASSGGTVIGDCEPPVHEDLVPRPKAPYGASKAAGEAYCSAYAGAFGLHTVALRFSNVYGPRSMHKNSVVARFVRRGLSGLPLEVYGDGDQTRDFLYVDDLVEAIVASSTANDAAGQLFHVASGRETAIGELAHLLSRILSEVGAVGVTVGRAPALAGEIRRNYAEATKARRELGWYARTDLEDGLRRTVEWFLDQDRHAE